MRNPYGPDPNTYETIEDLKTPEGYPVYFDESASPDAVYLRISEGHWEKFVKNTDAPGDWSTNIRFEASFLKNHQETYDGRKDLSLDPDFDGVTTAAENNCSMNPLDNDSDADGILDGIEYRACADFDSDGHPDANDTDSDADGITDGIEDASKNGKLDTGETDRLGTDTDGDGLADGTEDANHDGVKAALETSPIDRDTDEDGIPDKSEVDGTWCLVGEGTTACNEWNHNLRKTDPKKADTDGDGIWDGAEIGLTSPGMDTLTSAFRGDADASTTTDPMVIDSDGDGLHDGKEDLNFNGRVDSGEANPNLWDTDHDGLPDGRVSFSGTWKGEDLNNNGVRDKDANDEWNETDFLANDSDVDGVFDGAEINGTYCFKVGSSPCANTAHPLQPLVADTDADGLRDGQELAGWVVGIWYERTMEKKANISVTSDPWDDNSDADTLTDFSEFMNGSDPRSTDTDGDMISDTLEIERKSNITGIEGTPPQITDVYLEVGIDWDWWGFLYLPLRSHVTVMFKVTDNVGIGRLDVKFIRYSGTDRVHLEWGKADAPTSFVFAHKFDFSIAEALVAGADVNITAYDVNENGAWGEFHIKSVLEAIADAIAAFLSAIANAVMAALSAAFNWILGFVGALLDSMLKPVLDYLHSASVQLLSHYGKMVKGILTGDFVALLEGLAGLAGFVMGDIWFFVGLLLEVLQGLQIAITIGTLGIGAILGFIFDMAANLVISAVLSSVIEALAGPALAAFKDAVGGSLGGVMNSVLGALDPQATGPSFKGGPCFEEQETVFAFAAAGFTSMAVMENVYTRIRSANLMTDAAGERDAASEAVQLNNANPPTAHLDSVEMFDPTFVFPPGPTDIAWVDKVFATAKVVQVKFAKLAGQVDEWKKAGKLAESIEEGAGAHSSHYAIYKLILGAAAVFGALAVLFGLMSLQEHGGHRVGLAVMSAVFGLSAIAFDIYAHTYSRKHKDTMEKSFLTGVFETVSLGLSIGGAASGMVAYLLAQSNNNNQCP